MLLPIQLAESRVVIYAEKVARAVRAWRAQIDLCLHEKRFYRLRRVTRSLTVVKQKCGVKIQQWFEKIKEENGQFILGVRWEIHSVSAMQGLDRATFLASYTVALTCFWTTVLTNFFILWSREGKSVKKYYTDWFEVNINIAVVCPALQHKW